MPFTSDKRDCARCCNQYKCSYCPQQIFLNSYSLIKHLRKSLAHKSCQSHQTFDCTICNKTFALKTGYIHHLQQKRIHRYDLHQAACCGRYQDVSQLINSENANVPGASHKPGTQLNYQLGATPMHCAAFKGYSRCLKIMLDWQDGDPNVVDEYGQTPVHIAARCGRASSLKLLLSNGGRLDVTDINHDTPISLADGHDHCMNVVLRYKLQRTMLNYFKPEIFVQRSSSLQEIENIEKDGDISAGELSNITEESKTVCRSLSFPQGDNSDDHEEVVESELYVATKGTNTDTVALSSGALVGETIGNEQQVVGHHESMLEDGNDSIRKVSSDLVPYEIIARGENSVEAFKLALSEGTAPVSRLKLIFLGDVGAGKTSLTRSLSQQPFIEERDQNHGIETSTVCVKLVENTELDDSWKLADPGHSHFDDIIAKIVSESLPESTVSCPAGLSALPFGESEENQIVPGFCTSSNQPVTHGPQARVVVTQSSIPVSGTPRKLPATRIAKRLLQKNQEGSSFKVSIWDFAGHQLYETMHHVFMNNRSLYLVVFNLVEMSKSQVKCLARIHYWLNSIASHTSCSTPIILVGTHKAMVDSDFPKKTDQLIKKHFGSAFAPRLIRNSEDQILFAVENVEGQDDEGVSSLIKVIESEVSSSLAFVSDKYPLKWLHCEEEIIAYQQVSTNKKLMTLDEVKEFLQRKCDVTFTEEEFSSMLAFFHDSGLILLPDTTGETNTCIKDIVVLSPQYLVDVMTRLHDIPKDRHLKRTFSDDFKRLKGEGRANCRFLSHLWKDVECDLLIELLAHFNLLYPVDNEIDDDLKQENFPEDANSSSVQNVSKREFIIPCMLKEKSSESVKERWDGICENWSVQSTDEHVLVFDFGRFLPPPLFDYLAVHIYRHSYKTKGMRPFLTRRDCIFSFSDKFLFRLKLVLKDSQICVYARCKNGENFLNLACKLRERVSQICQRYFKFLKFICGPPCPRFDCPGASFDAEVVQRPCESSSSESQDSSDDDQELRDTEEKESKDQACGTGDQIGRRRHVIPMTPYSFDPPYWCERVAIDEDDLKVWNQANVTVEDLCQSFKGCEITDGSLKRVTEDCCLSRTADCLGSDWKEVTRKLGTEESEIENVVADHSTQKEHGFQGLKTWSKRLGRDADVDILKDTLREIGRRDVSEKLEKHYQDKHK